VTARLAVVLAAAGVAAGGCGDDEAAPSSLCLQGPEAIARSLERAPDPVRLADGTPLSDCVSNAQNEADLQTFGLIATEVADGLAARRDRASALRLGYLIGAASRGSARTQGVQAELLRRLQVTGRRVDDGLHGELERGRRAGERDG
jgi:hypothetical protein